AGASLVGGQSGVAFDDADAIHWNAKLFRHHLHHRNTQAGAHVNLTCIDRNGAVRVDGKKAVDLTGIDGFAKIVTLRCSYFWNRSTESEAHDNYAAGPQKITPVH